MIIAVNTQNLLKNKLEGIGWFTYECLKRITTQHPEHTFYFIFDRPYDNKFIFGSNVKPIVLSPPSYHPILWYIRFEFLLPRLLKKIKADLYITPDGWMPRKPKIKTLSIIHDINYVHHPEYLPYMVQKAYNLLFPTYTKNAAYICTVSEYSKKDICNEFKVPENKVSVIYNGANEIYQPVTNEIKENTKSCFSDGKPYFIFIGSLHPRKNLQNLFLAFDQFKETNNNEIKLLIVGAKRWWTKELQSIYNKLKHKEDIIFTGRVDNNQLHHLLASALALTYVSFYEGFGIPLLEAMYCEVPIITSNVTSMPEVGGNAAIYANPYHIESISQAMKEIANNEELRYQLIENGKKQKMRFNWDRSANLLWNSIQKLL